ncbi:MAG TPA: LysE family transporter [Bryobacteraceae bacterium]
MKAASTGFLLSLSLCLDLGIVNVAVLRTALQQGGTAAFLLGVGSTAGDLVYFTLAVFGATALLGWTPFRWALWLLGTAVLLFLSWRMLREVIHPKRIDVENGSVSPAGPRELLATGAGLALASPTSILWFAAVGGSVIASFGGDRASLWPFAAGFSAAALVWSAVFAYSAAALRRVLGAQLVRLLSLASGVLFLYFAAVVFLRGVSLLNATASLAR